VLHSQSLVSQWSNQMRVFLVRIAHSPETGEEALLVWARKTYQSAALAWDQPVDVEWIDSNHSPRMNEFIEAMKTNYAGVMALPFDGRDSIGAYARIEGPDYFVLVVPKSVFMSMPDQTSRLVLDYLRVSNWTALTGLAVAVLFVAVFAYIASKRMVQPLMILVHAAQRLARGDFTVRLDISARDERDLVYQSFNEMVPMLEERLSMSRALEVAQEVQKNLLPQQAPAAEGLDVAGASIYCERTGGDYFDYFHKPGNGSSLLAVLVGDVSGHGVSSALLMATARALLRLRASLPGQSADIIGDVNRLICQDTTHTGQFMTLFYAEFSPERDAVRWVRAGHEPALVYDPETNAFSELRGPGIAFGLDESFVFHENEAPLRPGRIILIGTDGIWETHNPEGRMFGKDALKAVIRQNADASSEAIIQAVYEALAVFRRQRPIEDDVTLVVVKVLS
jgi:sigma-B regulation protein RsbU (phosphoserine phosphatase)